ncbi:MAG: hypothetical protein CMH60_00785 [Myxococcales bacterium]|nr:hypothetical protein [Myxococcales bacterium]
MSVIKPPTTQPSESVVANESALNPEPDQLTENVAQPSAPTLSQEARRLTNPVELQMNQLDSAFAQKSKKARLDGNKIDKVSQKNFAEEIESLKAAGKDFRAGALDIQELGKKTRKALECAAAHLDKHGVKYNMALDAKVITIVPDENSALGRFALGCKNNLDEIELCYEPEELVSMGASGQYSDEEQTIYITHRAIENLKPTLIDLHEARHGYHHKRVDKLALDDVFDGVIIPARYDDPDKLRNYTEGFSLDEISTYARDVNSSASGLGKIYYALEGHDGVHVENIESKLPETLKNLKAELKHMGKILSEAVLQETQGTRALLQDDAISQGKILGIYEGSVGFSWQDSKSQEEITAILWLKERPVSGEQFLNVNITPESYEGGILVHLNEKELVNKISNFEDGDDPNLLKDKVISVLNNQVKARFDDLDQRASAQVNIYNQLEKDILACENALTQGIEDNPLLNKNLAQVHHGLKDLVKTWKVGN